MVSRTQIQYLKNGYLYQDTDKEKPRSTDDFSRTRHREHDLFLRSNGKHIEIGDYLPAILDFQNT